MSLIVDDYHMVVGFNKFARALPELEHTPACMHSTLAKSCQVRNIPKLGTFFGILTGFPAVNMR